MTFQGLDAKNSRTMAIAVVAVLCSFLPFETSHLFFMFAGAVGYIVTELLGSPPQEPKTATKASPRGANDVPYRSSDPTPAPQPLRSRPPRCIAPHPGQQRGGKNATYSSTTPWRAPQQSAETRKAEVLPPAAPIFKCAGAGWDAEVAELLKDVVPSAACYKCAADLEKFVRRLLPELRADPDASVVALVTGNLSGASARSYGIAVPDINLCLQTRPEVLGSMATKLRSPAGRAEAMDDAQDFEKSQKAVLRLCLPRFTNAGMKFKRTAFVGAEPKATLAVPSTLRIHQESVPLDFYVQSVTPQRYSSLLDVCKSIEPRAAELALLVKRWAKDRAICMSSKGHLPVYGWALLSIYYLQNGVRKPLLPLLTGLETPMDSKQVAERLASALRVPGSGDEASIGDIFKGFFRFFAEDFDWCRPRISVQCAPVATSGTSSSISATVPAFLVQDPFDEASNVATCLSAEGLVRLREELQRAHDLCSTERTSEGSVLSRLLEPWAPTEAVAVATLPSVAAFDDESQ